MTNTTEPTRKALKKYYREISRLLLCRQREKHEIIRSLRAGIDGYLAEHPACDMAEITRHFGSPEDIAAAYYNNATAREIAGKIHTSHKIVLCTAIGIAVALIIYAVAIATAWMENNQYSDNYTVVYLESVSYSDLPIQISND